MAAVIRVRAPWWFACAAALAAVYAAVFLVVGSPAFVRAPGRILTRDQLINDAWGPNTFVSDRVVDNHIGSLRKKLEPDVSEPRYLKNIRGLGYRFDLESQS